jgi:hypothetical protein
LTYYYNKRVAESRVLLLSGALLLSYAGYGAYKTKVDHLKEGPMLIRKKSKAIY